MLAAPAVLAMRSAPDHALPAGRGAGTFCAPVIANRSPNTKERQMRKAGIAAALAVGACVAVSAGGCQKNKHADSSAANRQKQDMRAQSEGHLEVDQSAVLPVDVRAGVMREYPGATVQNVTKKTDQTGTGGRPGVRYQVDLTTKDGKKVTREFDDKGKAGAQG
jgi:hypothetical protein